jgi:hypothetical protein
MARVVPADQIGPEVEFRDARRLELLAQLKNAVGGVQVSQAVWASLQLADLAKLEEILVTASNPARLFLVQSFLHNPQFAVIVHRCTFHYSAWRNTPAHTLTLGTQRERKNSKKKLGDVSSMDSETSKSRSNAATQKVSPAYPKTDDYICAHNRLVSPPRPVSMHRDQIGRSG